MFDKRLTVLILGVFILRLLFCLRGYSCQDVIKKGMWVCAHTGHVFEPCTPSTKTTKWSIERHADAPLHFTADGTLAPRVGLVAMGTNGAAQGNFANFLALAIGAATVAGNTLQVTEPMLQRMRWVLADLNHQRHGMCAYMY
jgi:hypothetical protein